MRFREAGFAPSSEMNLGFCPGVPRIDWPPVDATRTCPDEGPTSSASEEGALFSGRAKRALNDESVMLGANHADLEGLVRDGPSPTVPQTNHANAS